MCNVAQLTELCFSGAQEVPEPAIPQIPGPQVPPRLGQDPRQDRVLSVSGKKKCSHCKEELGKLKPFRAICWDATHIN